jgi:putative phosphoribosyl transferase
MRFLDRHDAGKRLGEWLHPLAAEHPVVLGLPRGGVPVAWEVARTLQAPLDVAVVRKLGVPFHPELGMGAIGEEGVAVLNEALISELDITPEHVAAVAAAEREELARRVRHYRGGRLPVPLQGRHALVVDDGLATGYTARAAAEVARRRGAARVTIAVPVGSAGTVAALRNEIVSVACLQVPEVLFAVGERYRDFSPTPDDEVVALLQSGAAEDGWSRRAVSIPVGTCELPGGLAVPPQACGVVAFAHGSGSSRHSPRNQAVAHALNQAGFATLLFDLLTPNEARDRARLFDIGLLAGRLATSIRWLTGAVPDVAHLPVGLFGASTGAAAALWAAAELDGAVAAVVSRGGRPDLAAPRLAEVTAPTLLIVGGRDEEVLALNLEAQGLLRCPTQLRVVPGATHLFEEPGALQQVQQLATDWFTQHLTIGDPAGQTLAPAYAQ